MICDETNHKYRLVLLCVCVSAEVSSLTALVGPHMQLLGQLRYDQECPPTLTLLGFENITKNMVSNVDNVFSLCPQQVTHNVRGTWECKDSIISCHFGHLVVSQLDMANRYRMNY